MEASEILKKFENLFDEVEVFLKKVESLEFELKNSKDFSKELKESSGLGIRVRKNNKEVFLSVPYKSKRLEEVISEAKEAIQHSKTLECQTIPINGTTYKSTKKTEKIDEKDAKERLKFLSSTAKNFDKRIADVKTSSIGLSISHIEIANNHGLSINYDTTYAAASIEVLAEDKTSDLAYYYLDSESLEKIDIEFLARKAASLAVNKLYPSPIQTKKYSVIISNNMFRDILSHFLSAFNGYSVINHTTPLKDRLNEKIFSDKITILDPIEFPNRPNNIAVDEEGNKRNNTIIVENGVLKTFMHNTYTSSKLGVKNNSHAKRLGYDSPPKIGSFNLHIAPNESIPQDKLLGMIDGVYITEIMGLHMANAISGDFSFGVNGFLVYNGELVSYFKAATFADNFFEIMKRIIEVSNNMYFSGSVGSPDVAIADCLIGGSSG